MMKRGFYRWIDQRMLAYFPLNEPMKRYFWPLVFSRGIFGWTEVLYYENMKPNTRPAIKGDCIIIAVSGKLKGPRFGLPLIVSPRCEMHEHSTWRKLGF